MSGGDGMGHNSGAHNSGGGINGGPTGFGGGGGNSGNSYSDNSGWSSENNPWGGGSSGGSSGPDGSNSGNSGDSNSGRRGDKNAKAKAIGELTTISAVAGTLTIATYNPFSSPFGSITLSELAAFFAETLTKAAPIAGRLLGVFGLFYPSSIGTEPPIDLNLRNREDNSYNVITLPTLMVSGVPAEDIPENTSVPANVLAQPVFDEVTKTRRVAITPVQATPVPVVKAEKTDEPNVYTAQVVPGMKPMRINVMNSKPGKQNQAKVNTTPALGQYLPAATEKDTHHAILDFGGEHDSIYISVSRTPKLDEEKKQLEEARRDWEERYPVEAAQEKLDIVNNELYKTRAEVNINQGLLNNLKNTPEGLALSNPRQHPIKSESYYEESVTSGPYRGTVSGTATAIIDSQENLNYLLAHDGLAYKRNILNDKDVVLSDDVEGDTIIYEAEYGEYDKLRQRLLDTRNRIAEAEKNLALAKKSEKEAENKKKTAQDKVDKENKRNQPGTATGKGKPVGDKWLHDAGKENGAPIPDRIADKLRGKKFRNFDDFRKQFWEEVSKDPELSKQFNKSNRKHITEGRSPYVPENEQVGGREVNEIHHNKPISQGGEVYDMDNLRITTPKRHIEIHRGKK